MVSAAVNGLSRSTITLVAVDTPVAEREFLFQIDYWRRLYGHSTAPVLDKGDLVDRLTRTLKVSGYEVVVDRSRVVEPARSEAAVASTSATIAPRRSIYYSSGVDAELAQLAAGLCGVRPLALASDTAVGAGCALQSAIVLVRTDAVNVSDIAAGLANLATARVGVGLVLIADPVDARFAILKALLIDTLSCSGDFAVLAPHLPMAQKAGAPQRLLDSNELGGAELLREHFDVVTLSGHATQIDANFGRSLILCGRATAEVTRGSRGVTYPCRANNDCFRQNLAGRSPQERDGLVAVTDLKASLLIFSGCNVAAIGRSWFDLQEGLAYQCQQTDILAMMVTTSAISRRLEIDVLILALLAEGHPIAAVSEVINRIRSNRFQHATALPAGIGPHIVLGNPDLTVEGLALQRIQAVNDPLGRLTIPLHEVEVSPIAGALLRVDLPPLPPGELMLMDRPDDMFCTGIVYDDEDLAAPSSDGHAPTASQAALYLWIGHHARASVPDHLTLAFVQPLAEPLLSTTIEAILRQMPFWTVFLAGYVRQARAAKQSPAVFENGLALVADGAGHLCELSNALREPPGTLRDAGREHMVQTAVWNTACSLGATLLDAVVEIACRFGTVQSHGWDTRLQRLEAVGPVEPCLCGSGRIGGQRYRMPDGGRLMRMEYQCAACGPIGEDDGRRLLRATCVPREASHGSTIVCEGIVTAPDDEFVLTRLCLVLESWMKTDRMVSQPSEILVAPGQTAAWVLSLQIPEKLAPGVYPIAVMGTVNGALTIVRQMLSVTGRPNQSANRS